MFTWRLLHQSGNVHLVKLDCVETGLKLVVTLDNSVKEQPAKLLVKKEPDDYEQNPNQKRSEPEHLRVLQYFYISLHEIALETSKGDQTLEQVSTQNWRTDLDSWKCLQVVFLLAVIHRYGQMQDAQWQRNAAYIFANI